MQGYPGARSGQTRDGTRGAYSGHDTGPSALLASGTTSVGLAVAVYGPRGLRPLGYVIPLPPGMSRAVRVPRCARARPAQCPAWLAMSTAPRRHASAMITPSHSFRHDYCDRRARRSAAWLVKPTRILSSPLTRLAHPVPASASGLCHRTCLKPSSAPSPPAHPPRERGSSCRRSFPASQSHEPRHQRCHGFMLIPSSRVMLSAHVIGHADAHHRVQHRACHGFRGGVASPLQRFALVVPCRRDGGPMRHTHRVNA